MKVMVATSEAVPYAKTGGLADVAGSLSKSLVQEGADVCLVMPLYPDIMDKFSLEKIGSVPIRLGASIETAEIFSHNSPDGFKALFIGHEGFFNRDELYATAKGEYPDNDKRFIFFSKAVLESAQVAGFLPDIIHLNDWQTALVPALLRAQKRWDFPGTSTLLTVHNMGFQGIFEPEAMRYTGLPYEFFNHEMLEFYGKLNLLKAGIVFSDAVSTVSERYASEIQTKKYGHGLEGVLTNRSDSISGIVNGIDYSIWNPEDDEYLPANYGPSNPDGKIASRGELERRCRFKASSKPILAMVGRLAYQKGVELLIATLPDLVRAGARVVVLGRGEDKIEKSLTRLSEKFSDNLFVSFEFNDPLAHLIYAGSDILLMPSRYEPCGLSQMIAMRYGTPPVVMATGGLADTVVDASGGGGTGFVFHEHKPKAFRLAVDRAMKMMEEQSRWSDIIRRTMSEDFSWSSSARRYMTLYREIVSKVNA